MDVETRRARRMRPSAALIVAIVALVFSMAGGAFAALDLIGRNDIKSKHVKNQTLTAKDVKDGALTGGELKDGSVGAADIGDSAVGAGEVSEDGVASAEIAAGSITASELGDVVIRQETLNDTDDTADDNDWEATMGEVDCLPGERAIGGGATLSFAPLEDTAITRSDFDPSGDGSVDGDEGWIVGIVSDQGGAGDKTIQVYCLK